MGNLKYYEKMGRENKKPFDDFFYHSQEPLYCVFLYLIFRSRCEQTGTKY